jgi:PAS domain S-box-containing protein
MKNSGIRSEAAILRQKAEELHKKKPEKTASQLSEHETLKLLHELEVHQIELELQNEELVQAKTAEHEASEKYIELYDFAPSGYFTISSEGKIIELNLSGASMLGKERSLIKNSLFGVFVSNNSKPIFNFFLKKVFNSRIRETCEVTLSTEIDIPMHVQLTGIAAEKGDQCLVNMIDITARIMAEEALAVSETRYRRLFESAKDGILILDAETGKIRDANQSFLDLTDYSKAHLIEKAIWEIGTFKDVVDNYNKFLELQQQKYARYEDLPIETSKGEKIDVEIVSNVYTVNRQKLIQCNVRDISRRKMIQEELKASEAKLKEINATKDMFFSIIAHDLKSPFNSILGFSQLLKEEVREMDLKTIAEFADAINRASQQVFHLLENLLSWARLQQGQMLFNPTNTDLKQAVNEIIELLTENANKKKIRVVNHIPDRIMVSADGNMLKATVRNLLSNALKFTSENGKVELSAAEDNTQVKVSVRDNGKGMKSEDLGKLFNIGLKYTTRGTEEEEGTGLGLILCKEFVEKHGGEIWAESEPEKGSTFYFTLPNFSRESSSVEVF